MKKRVIIAAIFIMIALVAGVGCTGTNDVPEDEFIFYDFDLAEFVEVGQYIGIEVPASLIPNLDISDEELLDEVEMRLSVAAEMETLTSGVVMMRDNANIDFAGSRDGVLFDGGSAQGFDLLIGSGRFIPGFEEGLLGTAIGGTVVIDITFPDDYHADHLAGVEVQFEVTVNHVVRFTLPELTDEFVRENSVYSTVEEFKESVREDMIEERLNAETHDLDMFLVEMLIENATILRLPDREVEELFEMRKQDARDFAASENVNWEDFLEILEVTEDGFDELLMEEVVTEIEFEMVMLAIARKEGIELTDELFDEGVLRLLQRFEFPDEEAFIATFGTTFEEAYGRRAIELTLIYELVIEIIRDNVVVME